MAHTLFEALCDKDKETAILERMERHQVTREQAILWLQGWNPFPLPESTPLYHEPVKQEDLYQVTDKQAKNPTQITTKEQAPKQRPMTQAEALKRIQDEWKSDWRTEPLEPSKVPERLEATLGILGKIGWLLLLPFALLAEVAGFVWDQTKKFIIFSHAKGTNSARYLFCMIAVLTVYYQFFD